MITFKQLTAAVELIDQLQSCVGPDGQIDMTRVRPPLLVSIRHVLTAFGGFTPGEVMEMPLHVVINTFDDVLTAFVTGDSRPARYIASEVAPALQQVTKKWVTQVQHALSAVAATDVSSPLNRSKALNTAIKQSIQ